jgi:hypothetical protein
MGYIVMASALVLSGITVIMDFCYEWRKGAKIALSALWSGLSIAITIIFYNYL